MAITIVQISPKGEGNNVASAAASFTALPTAGNAVLVCAVIRRDPGHANSACTDNQGNTYAKQIQFVDAKNQAEIWADFDIGTPSGTYTVTLAGNYNSGNYIALYLVEVSGLVTTGVLDQSATGTTAFPGTPTSVGPTGATDTADELVLGVISFESTDSNLNITTPTGYTEIGVEQSSAGKAAIEACSRIVSATGTQAATWNHDGTANTGAVLATFRAASGGITEATGTASGSGSASGVGAAIETAAGSAAGAGAASGAGQATAGADGSSAGSGVASGSAAAIDAAAGSASGAAGGSGVGAAIDMAAGTSAGAGAASGAGAAVAGAVGASDGLATASAVGEDAAGSGGTGSASGTSAATGAGAGVAQADGTIAGSGAATGAGAGVAQAEGSATGSSGGGGTAQSLAAGVGASSGQAAAAGASGAIVGAVGEAVGQGASQGVAELPSAIPVVVMLAVRRTYRSRARARIYETESARRHFVVRSSRSGVAA